MSQDNASFTFLHRIEEVELNIEDVQQFSLWKRTETGTSALIKKHPCI